MLSPNDIEFDGMYTPAIILMYSYRVFEWWLLQCCCTGWDINSSNIADACERARVLDIGIQDQLRLYLEKLRPRPSIYCQDFIAANQEERANNVLKGQWHRNNLLLLLKCMYVCSLGTKAEMMKQIRADIKDFKTAKKLDKVRQKFKVCDATTAAT